MLDQDTRQGAKLTPNAASDSPVIERAMAAAELANLLGCAIDLPVTLMLYWPSLALRASIQAVSFLPAKSLSPSALSFVVVAFTLGSVVGSHASLPVALSLAATSSPHLTSGSTAVRFLVTEPLV